MPETAYLCNKGVGVVNCNNVYTVSLKVKARISVQEKRLSVHRMGPERLGSDGKLSPRTDKSSLSLTSLSANVSESELSGTESTPSLQSASSSMLPQINENSVDGKTVLLRG